MKHFFKLTILASVVTALIFGVSAFTSVKKVKGSEDGYLTAKSSQKQPSIR